MVEVADQLIAELARMVEPASNGMRLMVAEEVAAGGHRVGAMAEIMVADLVVVGLRHPQTD